MSCVAGIDLSTKAIEIVRLDETGFDARWFRYTLEGPRAFDRLRETSRVLPLPSWWDDVYLAAVEEPWGRFTTWTDRAFGAVIAKIPHTVVTWRVDPKEWKRELGLKQAAKNAEIEQALRQVGFPAMPSWPYDAWDALGVAWFARETNARAVSAA